MLNLLEQKITTQYEDIAWKMAYGNDEDALKPEAMAVYFAAKKSIDDLVKDSLRFDGRIRLQPEIAERIGALDARDAARAKRQKLVDEFEAVRQAHEAQLQAINADISSANRRINNTSKAYQHYRLSVPEWLKAEREAVGKQLTRLAKQLGSNPPNPPSDPSKRMDLQVMDSARRNELYSKYEAAKEQHALKLEQYAADQQRLRDEEARLLQLQDAIEHTSYLLRPTPEDLQRCIDAASVRPNPSPEDATCDDDQE